MGRQVQIIERFSSIEAQVVESVVVPGGEFEQNFSQPKVGEGGRGRREKLMEREEGVYTHTAHICVLASFGECLEDWDVGCC